MAIFNRKLFVYQRVIHEVTNTIVSSGPRLRPLKNSPKGICGFLLQLEQLDPVFKPLYL